MRTPLWSHQQNFPSELKSVPRARHFVCAHLIEHRILYLVEDVRLVVSEFATNAVRHAKTPFTVTLEQVDQHVQLIVADGSPIRPARPVRLATNVKHTTGRGLSIVDLVSRDWGVTRQAGETKAVWATFALRAAMPERHIDLTGDEDLERPLDGERSAWTEEPRDASGVVEGRNALCRT